MIWTESSAEINIRRTSRKAYIVARIASPLIATLWPPMPSMFASSALVTGGILFIIVIEVWRETIVSEDNLLDVCYWNGSKINYATLRITVFEHLLRTVISDFKLLWLVINLSKEWHKCSLIQSAIDPIRRTNGIKELLILTYNMKQNARAYST